MMRSAFDRISNSRGSAIRQRGLPRKLPFINLITKKDALPVCGNASFLLIFKEFYLLMIAPVAPLETIWA